MHIRRSNNRFEDESVAYGDPSHGFKLLEISSGHSKFAVQTFKIESFNFNQRLNIANRCQYTINVFGACRSDKNTYPVCCHCDIFSLLIVYLPLKV